MSHGNSHGMIHAHGLAQTRAAGQPLSDKAMALDSLLSCESELLRDAISVVESTHPALRDLFVRMQSDHSAMQRELLEFARRRGWRRVPEATHQVINCVAPGG